ncbi:hypothetical protein AKUH3B204M_13600 [Apilactobacillus kunkeei]|uniref:mucin-binding protein n=1 Tax=Apilactobacillus kunkeei TaxID=148814 RepID=UPI0022012A19|nr:leucine-rich repeat domain-containing protein [Apilactobacillus kunkeei]UZX33116.1 LPXTG cell wall anchor domain-containing protein [Apilactobacillus kunkeei]CAI2663548.1 hypothetical protein AKUH3B204M_13600 [Apilactobacillus kunkeei]CAI2663943.1 hypothetical protein AKUA1802_14240 [Apilactobacillus kunkeei]CAI2665340.1 hypothetical protein AKUA0901_14230 [Apilactobacillus kunkeei]CAI2666837.1 hypothetical protein AKUA1201_14220 [Apilactobacillus kunkeei]
MKKTSLKTALLFSTLVFGTVQANALINQSNNYSIVAHADSSNVDTSTTNIASIKDNTVKNILLSSVNSQEHKNYSDASQITNDDLAKLTSIIYNGNGSEKISSLDNFSTSILPNVNSISITNVDASSIKDLSPFTKWTNLNNINLSNDNISSTQLSTLGEWSDSSLTDINLSSNNINSLEFLKNISIPNIKSINVSHNQISDFTPVVNKQWNNLTNLNAGFNHIEDISPIAKVNWTNLQNLNVESNNISDISVITSANWPNLLKLYADNNNITDINAFADTNWTKLEVISAAGNHISNVSALKGKSTKFPNLSTFIVNNNNINDISWMDGFKFNSSSVANQQIINSTVNVVKQADGKSVFIQLPITISDVNLDNNLKASADSKGENLQANNDYLNNDDGNSFNQNGTIIDSSNVIGNDGKANSSVRDSNGNYKSNGISGVNILSGNGSQKYTFGFTSTLGINQNDYFNGAYNINVNWGKNVTQEKTVKVIVNYIGDDGKTLDTKSKSVKFTETGFQPDDSSKQTDWNNDWTTSDDTKFSFISSQYDGYQSPSQSTVSGNLTPDSNDLIETVSYKAIKSSAQSSETNSSSAQSSASSSEANSSSAQSSAQSSEANSSSAQSSASSSETNSSSAQSSASSSEANSSSAQSSASSSEANSSSAQSSVTNEHSNNASNPTQSSSAESSSAQSSAVSNNGNNAGKPTSENSATPTTPATTPSTGNNSGKPNKEVTIKHVDPAVPGHKNNASHPATENKNKLPQTGDKTEQNVLVSLGVVAIATALGLAAFALRRKNK